MAALNLHELYVVGQTAAYMSLDMIGDKVYTDKAEADAALENTKKSRLRWSKVVSNNR